jgi:hypothetical protein
LAFEDGSLIALLEFAGKPPGQKGNGRTIAAIFALRSR